MSPSPRYILLFYDVSTRGKKPFFHKWGFKINVANLYNSDCTVAVILKLRLLSRASLFRGRVGGGMSWRTETVRVSKFLSGGRGTAVGTVGGAAQGCWALNRTPGPCEDPNSAPALANTIRGPR